MVCERCNRELGSMVSKITDGVKTIHLCPNCVAISFYNGNLSFINNSEFIDDVTGKPGAVRYVSRNEEYYLERRAMMRLLTHNLRKAEYLALAAKYGANQYMLHSDFYSQDGKALQPTK